MRKNDNNMDERQDFPMPPNGKPPIGMQPPNGEFTQDEEEMIQRMRMQGTKPPPNALGRGGPPIGLIEKPKNFGKSIKTLLSYSKKYMPIMIIAILLAIASAVFYLIGPNSLSTITDLIIDGLSGDMDIDLVVKISTFLVIIYGLSLVFSYLQSFIMATVSQRVSKNMRTDLCDKFNKLPLSYFDSHSYGDMLSRVTNDVDTIGTSLNQSMASIVTAVFTFTGALILMVLTNWIMALAGFVSTFIGFSLMSRIIKKSQKYFKAQQIELGGLNGHIEEVYTGHTVLKAYGGEKLAKHTFKKGNQKLCNASCNAQFISGLMMPIMGFIGNLAYVVVCVVGAILALQGTITFGVIVAFMVYIRLFTQPLTTLSQSMTTLQSAAAASERVFDMLYETELSKESDNIVKKESIKGDIEFENVMFGYKKDKLIIKDFSAKIKAGSKVAIVGPTGAGKTTIVNLLMRFYELSDGNILIDNTPISQIKRENLHEIFAMVLQDTWMFDGSIKENIAYNQSNVTDEEIVNACKSVGIHHTIMTLKNGYDTVLNDSTLSVGEKQLLTIARAMVKKSDLLILDEATSSVDTRTEILIQNAMDTLSQNKTSFIIAHRLSTIKNADVILVMKDGNIVENGNHETLLEKNGFYAELYNSQFENNTQ